MTEREQKIVEGLVGSANQHNPTLQVTVTFADGKAIFKQFGLEATCFTFSDAYSLLTQWVMMTAIGMKA